MDIVTVVMETGMSTVQKTILSAYFKAFFVTMVTMVIRKPHFLLPCLSHSQVTKDYNYPNHVSLANITTSVLFIFWT